MGRGNLHEDFREWSLDGVLLVFWLHDIRKPLAKVVQILGQHLCDLLLLVHVLGQYRVLQVLGVAVFLVTFFLTGVFMATDPADRTVKPWSVDSITSSRDGPAPAITSLD